MSSPDLESTVDSTVAKQNRLPRYRRAQREGSLILTPRDLDILRIIESHRVATSEHIQALADGSNQGILRRLQKLYHGGYVERMTPQRMYGNGSQKMIYA